MRSIIHRGGRRAAAAFLTTLALGACSVDSLLVADDPDLILPGTLTGPDGALGLRLGALSRFRDFTGGTESTWLFGGLLADEWSTSSTFVQNDEADQRAVQENNGSITTMFRTIHRARTAANQAIVALRTSRPTPAFDIGEMYLARGFAELQLASDFCNGIPLSDGAAAEPTGAPRSTVAQVLGVAVSSLDSAIALANGTTTGDLLIARAARVAKARALLALNRPADAATEVAGIATSYTYDHSFAATSGDNTIWGQGASSNRYTIGDSVEGNARRLLVGNAIPFHSARDPRLPSAYRLATNGRDTLRSQDGLTFSRVTTLYGRSTSLPVVNGIDARMIEAEAFLRANNTTQWLAIHNALRATPPRLGDVQPTAMPPLTDPGNQEARISLHFREKAFWTFSRGQRLGDLRRLVRQYSRPVSAVFPTGVHYKGGNYGTDVNFPVPFDERNNPQFSGCIDRNA